MSPLADRWVVPLAGLAAASPAASALIRGLRDAWTPEGDRAVVATRAYDVLTADSPLVGAFSTSSVITGEDTFSLGPLLYWLLALPTRVPGEGVLPVVMSVVNGACAVGIVALAHRRGGRPLMIAAGTGVALLWASLPSWLPIDVWAPSAPVMPFALLVFACWSVACGDHRLLPLSVLLAAFAMQGHLAFVLPCLGLLAVALAGLVLGRHRPPRRWMAASALVAAVAWSAPVLDQVLAWTGDEDAYGNLETVADAAGSRGETIGAAGGARAVVRAVGVPPWWLRADPEPADRTFEVFEPLPAPALLSALAVLIGLLACLAVARRRRRPDVVAACATALVLCTAIAVVTAGFPEDPRTVFSFSYASWWAAPAGMYVWLALGWSVAVLARPARGRIGARARPALAPVGLGLGLGLVVAGSALTMVRWNQQEERSSIYAAVRSAVQRLEQALPAPGTVRVEGPAFGFETAIVYSLRRRGAAVSTRAARELGPAYTSHGKVVDQVVEVHNGHGLPRGARLVVRVSVPPPDPVVITVGLRPGPGSLPSR